MAILTDHAHLSALPRVGYAIAHDLIGCVAINAVEASLMMNIGLHPFEDAIIREGPKLWTCGWT